MIVSEGLCIAQSASFRPTESFRSIEFKYVRCFVARWLELIWPQSWNGGFFKNVTLESLGLVINLIHHDGICPVCPETQLIIVIDLSGYHLVRVRFCACSHSSFLEPFRQFLRVRWYPASILRPKTVFTFDLLDTYHKLSLQGKLNLYDFYTAIMQKTDNCGHLKVKVC